MKLHWLSAGLIAGLILGTPRSEAQSLMDTAPPMPKVNYPDAASQHEAARRSATGMYAVRAEINGEALPMMFDTGASYVALRAEDAERVGIDASSLRYTARVSTANGQTMVAPVMIRTITISGITRHNIQAIVARPGELGTNLLGQSFMARLSGYRLEGDRLVLQGD